MKTEKADREERVERAEKIVDDYFTLAPRYRVRGKLAEAIAAELAECEALVSALRAAAEKLAGIDNGCMVLHGDCGCDDCQLVTQCYAALQAAGA